MTTDSWPGTAVSESAVSGNALSGNALHGFDLPGVDLAGVDLPEVDLAEVAIITPAWNAAATLDETIRSVRAQSHARWTLWVVDDGSTDATAAIVRRHLVEDRRVRLIQQPNRGAAHARNAALERATGTYVAFLDADDCWQPRFLERMIAALEADPAAGLAWSDMEVFGDGSGLYRGSAAPIAGPAGTTLAAIYGGVTFLPSCTLMRRRFFQAGLRWRQETSPMEDMPIFLEVARQAGVVHVPETLARYRIHTGSSTSARGAVGRNYPTMAYTFTNLYRRHRRAIPRRAYHERLWWIYHHAGDSRVRDGERPTGLLLRALRHRPTCSTTWKVLGQALFPGLRARRGRGEGRRGDSPQSH